MDEKEIFEKLKKIILQELEDVTEDMITMDASFLEDLNASSIELFDLILAIEDEFEIEVPDEDAMEINTIGEAVEYLKKRIH